MQQAALLAEIGGGLIRAYDTVGTAAGAATAARAAAKAGTPMVLGPLSREEAPAVAQVFGGRIPVVAFSNDPAVRGANMFQFGISAGQASTAILRYARGRGVRRVLVLEDASAWSAASADAAVALESELGLSVRRLTVAPGQPLPAVGDAPDAVLIPDGGADLLSAARALKETGVQLLGTFQGVDYRPEAVAALEGAWIASPDPADFGDFAGRYAARNGGRPGTIAALAFDAAGIAVQLNTQGALTREGLLSERGFECVTGNVRFRTDGSCARRFAILVSDGATYAEVATSQGA